MKLGPFLDDHADKVIEVAVLLFIFVFSTLMLAYFKNEEMARWIENGAIITILARAFGTNGTGNGNGKGTPTLTPGDTKQ